MARKTRKITFQDFDISAVALALNTYAQEQKKLGNYSVACGYYKLASEAWKACDTEMSTQNAAFCESEANRLRDRHNATFRTY